MEDSFIVGRCNIDTVQVRVEVFYGSSQLGDDNNKVEMNAIVACNDLSSFLSESKTEKTENNTS